jgi:N,N'-diacetyllegionaminate synthase
MTDPHFATSFEIGGKPVGGDSPCLFIAEAGVAHFGDWDLACQLVDLAADAGADIFKTQFFDPDILFADGAQEWRDRLRPRNLSLDQFKRLRDRCDDRGLLFMSTAHDESRISWLEELEVPAVKVGSGERSNPDYLRQLAALGKPMIVSTGMYSVADIHEATKACADGGCTDLALLHCVTSYPTPDEDVNLQAMDRLHDIFAGPVGYSDHTPDHIAVLSAVARGAKVIEKHITILRDVPNAQDWKVSAGPEDLAELIDNIRRVEAQLGDGDKALRNSETASTEWALKSLVARHDLPAGHVITADDLIAKRPGTGILPNRVDEVIGRTLKAPLAADVLLLLEHLRD